MVFPQVSNLLAEDTRTDFFSMLASGSKRQYQEAEGEVVVNHPHG